MKEQLSSEERAKAEEERKAKRQALEEELIELEREAENFEDISLTGVQVTSGKYGKGMVIAQKANQISVRFENIEKSFILDEKYSARPRFENDIEIVSA